MSTQWSVYFLASAEGDLRKLDAKIRKRILLKIEWFSAHFEEVSPLSLTGEFKGFFKLRIGDWRVLYKAEWNERQLIICFIGHRRQVYRPFAK